MASKSSQQEPEKAEVIEELLDVVDVALDRVKVLYEQYFLGIQKQAPSHLHNDVERKLRELAQMQIRNTALRYRMATLQQKFGSYNSYWRRTLRQIENGTYTRSLSRVGRQAARTGAAVPEEILAAMPKIMREQVRRDREAALVLATHKQPPSSSMVAEISDEMCDVFEEEEGTHPFLPDEPAAMIVESTELRRSLRPAPQTYVLDDSEDVDLSSFFDESEDVVAPPIVRFKRGPDEPTIPSQPQLPRAPEEARREEPQAPARASVPSAPMPARPTPKVPMPLDRVTPATPRAASSPGAADSASMSRAGSSPAAADPRAATPRAATSPGVAEPPRAPSPGPAGSASMPQAVVSPPRVGTSRIATSPGAADPPRTTSPSPAASMPRAATSPGTPRPATSPAQRPPTAPPEMPRIPPPTTPPAMRPLPTAPSQVTRPIPVVPGASARTAAQAETLAGPFPRVATAPAAAKPAAPARAASDAGAKRPEPRAAGDAGPKPRAAPAPDAKPLPPGMTDADVNALYARYVKAKEMVGENAGPGAYGKLLKTINAQAPKIMEQYKAKAVDFSIVVKDNQVIIRAKPKV